MKHKQMFSFTCREVLDKRNTMTRTAVSRMLKKIFSHGLSSFALFKIGKPCLELFLSQWEDAWSMFFIHSKNSTLEDILFNDLPFGSYYLFGILRSSQRYNGQTHTHTQMHTNPMPSVSLSFFCMWLIIHWMVLAMYISLCLPAGHCHFMHNS